MDARGIKDTEREKEEGMTNIKVSNTSSSAKQLEERNPVNRRGGFEHVRMCMCVDLNTIESTSFFIKQQ